LDLVAGRDQICGSLVNDEGGEARPDGLGYSEWDNLCFGVVSIEMETLEYT
jgi:hypothetical protein